MPVLGPPLPYTIKGDTSNRASSIDDIDIRAVPAGAAALSIGDRIKLLATGGAGDLTPARSQALDRLINDLTALRAGRLDNLDRAVSALVQAPTFKSVSSANPAANQILADTGPLAANNYKVILAGNMDLRTLVGQQINLTHRNALDTADVQAARVSIFIEAIGIWPFFLWWPYQVTAANERFRLYEASGVAPGANNNLQWSLYAVPA